MFNKDSPQWIVGSNCDIQFFEMCQNEGLNEIGIHLEVDSNYDLVDIIEVNYNKAKDKDFNKVFIHVKNKGILVDLNAFKQRRLKTA